MSRHPGVQDLETTVRVTPSGSTVLFLLNHRAEAVEVKAERGGTDLLTGMRVQAGDPVKSGARGVLLLREED